MSPSHHSTIQKNSRSRHSRGSFSQGSRSRFPQSKQYRRENAKQKPIETRDRPRDQRSSPRNSREKNATVLDFFQPIGTDYSVAVVLGHTFFTLLQLQLPKDYPRIRIGTQVGLKKRALPTLNIRRISYDDLSPSAKTDLESETRKILQKREKDFVAFFNSAESITTHLHQLRLLPGIGTKRMWKVLETRQEKPFSSFEDIKERSGISDPIGILLRRIIDEIEGEVKYRLFTRPLQSTSTG